MRDIGITGTRQGLSSDQRNSVVDIFGRFSEPHILHHGDCVGVDEQVAKLAYIAFHWDVVSHPPIDDKLRAYYNPQDVHEPLHYLERNVEIVKASEFVIACPKEMEEQHGSGTWFTVKAAYERDVPVVLILPDGFMTTYDPPHIMTCPWEDCYAQFSFENGWRPEDGGYINYVDHIHGIHKGTLRDAEEKLNKEKLFDVVRFLS